ncbi:MAG: hypothetical protein ACI8P9_003541 [Parasphingorhabdus sp.]
MTIEKKYTFDNRLHQSALNLAHRLMIPNSDYAESIVNSVYFDTRNREFLAEKENSDYLKCKIRLRWYDTDSNSTQGPRYFLEVKRKNGVRRDKARIDVTEHFFTNSVRRSLPLNLDQVNNLLREHVDGNFPKLMPLLLIRYNRRRFHTNLDHERVNVDWNISAQGFPVRHNSRSSTQVLPSGVIEAKGSHFDARGPVSTLIKATKARKNAFSKYLVGYQFLEQI